MNVYNDIVKWSSSKPMFVRDALRRLFRNRQITEQDISELKEIIKKDHGLSEIDINTKAVSEEDIPSEFCDVTQIRIKQISSPHNIAALFGEKPLIFSPKGLSIVYGKNGSGKSSYSKILKKLCWSRDKDVVLKKNVYTNDLSAQSVAISFFEGEKENTFVWQEGKSTDKRLNSIYVFDSKCADIYLNKENPAEYKPVGIDVLERLVELYASLSASFDSDIQSLQKKKPQLAEKYKDTSIFSWYDKLKESQRKDIEEKISFTSTQNKRYEILDMALKDSNVLQTNNILKLKKERYHALQKKLSPIEKLFEKDSLNDVKRLKEDFKSKEQANKVAIESYKTDNEFDIGGTAWKELWNAARKYAEELQKDYPVTSNAHGSFCILCHQPLSDKAKERVLKFDSYVQDATSKSLNQAKIKKDQKLTEYISIPHILISDELRKELIEDGVEAEKIEAYCSQILKAKEVVANYIQDVVAEICPLFINSISDLLTDEIKKIDEKIKINEDILTKRELLEKEFLELDALKSLNERKEDILAYYDETLKKAKLQECKNVINSRSVSNKVGELLESKAISKQQSLFLEYLNKLNNGIAKKMTLKKTRTTTGVTYQKCGFNSIKDSVTDILSEGEQKMVAIANFLSECAISDTHNAIIFDDPITSLDVDYRESVAKIIVEMSADRQIIVMTHDLYFLRLLKDIYNKINSTDCYVTCLNSVNNQSGIVSDEIPFLSKNIQERIDTITKGIENVKKIDLTQLDTKRIHLNDLKDKMRQLLERTVEDVLINKAVIRFGKNVNFKKSILASLIVIKKEDIDFLTSLYGKYSEVIHDGSVETVPNTITEMDISTDIRSYKDWKDEFVQRVKDWKKDNRYE